MLGRRKNKKTSHEPSWGLFYLPRVTSDQGIFAAEQADDIFTSFLRSLERYTGKRVPSVMYDHPDNAVNQYVVNYGLVVIMLDTDGNKVCYSSSYRNKLPMPFLDRVRSSMGLMPGDTVLWSDDVFRRPEEASAREVVYGEKPEKPPRKPTRAEVRTRWAHAKELGPDEMSYLMGKSEVPPDE